MLKDIRKNPLMLSDAYNLSHQRLKINVDWEVSHVYNRAKGMILYGITEAINTILSIQITTEMIDEAKYHAKRMGLNFPSELFERVVNECNGYFPLEVQILPEGTYCPAGTPFAQVRNTVEGFGELVTWLEPIFMMAHFPATCATQAFRMRKYLEQKRKQYSFDESFMWRFHSFGFRGHRSLEDAYWAGTAWNLFLQGTDDFHTAAHTPEAVIGSISAQGHKVTQQFDVEMDSYIHAINATAEVGEKIVALVIDTYDSDRFITEYLVPVAEHAKTKGVHVVLRPDSGNTWEQVADAYKVVRTNKIDNVSAIIGEGMSFDNAKKADEYFESLGIPLTFVSYGIGGGFYGYMNRDTLGFAMKTAYSNGAPRMKFSMIPLKRSIPGAVVINRNEDGDLIVDHEKSAYENSQYRTIYYHIDGISNPYSSQADWESTQKLALTQNMNQHVIYLSKGIQDMIQDFQLKYKGV